MGEIADMMLDGTMCAGCGEWLNDGEDGDGFPEFCFACAGQMQRDETKAKAEWDSTVLSIALDAINLIERAFGDKLHPDIKPLFTSQMKGMVNQLKVTTGPIDSPSLRKQLATQKRDRERSFRQRHKNQGKLGV